MRSNIFKSLAVSDRSIGILPHVVAERLFVEVAEQMEWLDTHISSLNSALEQAPEVFEIVGVNVPVDVGNRMVNNLVRVVCGKIVVRWQRIGEKNRAGGHVFADFLVQSLFPAIGRPRAP